MPRRCSVCDHAQRAEIDAALVAGESFRDIAGRFGLGKSAVERHKAAHIPAALAQAQDAQNVAQADDLLAQVRNLQSKALSILSKAEKGNDLRTALQAIREARGNLELLAKLLGELQQGAVVNVLVSLQWVEMRTLIVATLGPYPQAKQALVEALSHAGA